MGYLNGTDLLLFHDDGTKKPFAGSTSHSLSINNELRDTATKDSANWLEKIKGRSSWSISCDGLVSFDSDYGYAKLFDLMKDEDSIEIVFAIADRSGNDVQPDTTKINYTGKVIIESLEMSAADNDNTTYSVTLQGSGELTKVDAEEPTTEE